MNEKSQKQYPANLIFISIIILAGFISYWNALENGIIWDDYGILESPAIKELSLSNIIRSFTDKNAYHAPGEIYRPLYLISFAINYKLHGPAPWGYHLVNIIIHILNSIIIFYITSLFINRTETKLDMQHKPEKASGFVKKLPAFITAVFFVIHPIHTESVTWIKGRDDVMAFFFFLLAFYLYIKSIIKNKEAEGKGKKPINDNHLSFFNLQYLISLFFYILALLSKEMAITLPFLFILHDYCFSPYELRNIKRWFLYIPFFLITGVYLIVRTNVLGQVAQTEYLGGSFGQAILTMTKGTILYLKLLIFPIGLCGDYLAFPISRTIDLEVIYSIFIIVVIITAGIISYRYNRSITFSIFWFFITLLPVSNIVPIKISIAERFLYIPSFSIVILAGIGIKILIGSHFYIRYKKIFAVLFLISIVFYTYGTIQRNKVWKDEFSFWENVLSKYPSSRAYTNLGLAYMEEKGLPDQAIEYYEKALSLDPQYSYALNNIAIAFIEKDLLDEAIDKFKEALTIEPDNPEIHINLGRAYNKKHFSKEAIAEYTVALQLKPDIPHARDELAKIYMDLGKVDEARRLLLE
jgi:hypothetical protein